jgi:hypothetical protein
MSLLWSSNHKRKSISKLESDWKAAGLGAREGGGGYSAPAGCSAPIRAPNGHGHKARKKKINKKNIGGKLQNQKQEQEGSRKEQGTEVVGTPYPVIEHRTQ